MNKEEISILEAIFDKSQDGILFCDTNGIIKLWNSGCERIFGYKAEEAIGRSLNIIIPENLQEKHWKGFYRALENRQSKYATISLSVVANRKDNSLVPIDFRMNVLTKNDQAIGIFAIIRDSQENTTPFFK